MAEYEAVIGLEVHVELATTTKLFCGCPNEFGSEPNTNICPICLGLPGSLPVLNRRVVEYALRLGEAMHFDVPPESIFHRKNYFYPDMPKDYQVSQYDAPICVEGWMEIDGTRIRIERAHMEEDTGKTQHIGGGGRIHDATHSLVDYNRAGVPLMEIVSQPGHPQRGAGARVRQRAARRPPGDRRVGREDGGRLDAGRRERVDPPRRHRGARHQGRGQEHELAALARPRDRLRDRSARSRWPKPASGSSRRPRGWDEAAGVSQGMRSKEGSNDYRYFPEPDLVPGRAERRDARRRHAPRCRSCPRTGGPGSSRSGGSRTTTRAVLVDNPLLADYADAAVALGAPGKDVANWCTGEILGYLNESGLSPEVLPLPPDGLAELIGLVTDGTLSRSLAKDVLNECLPRAEAAEAGGGRARAGRR